MMRVKLMRTCATALALCASDLCIATRSAEILEEGTGEGFGVIQVDVTQDGFAGRTGQRWTFEKGGGIRVARLGPREQLQPLGVWPVDQDRLRSITRLAEALCRESPPARLGDSPAVNPVTVAFHSARCQTQLKLPAGSDPTVTAAPRDDPHRVAIGHLLALVRELPKPSESPP